MVCTVVSAALWIVQKVVLVLVIVLASVLNGMCYMAFPDAIEGQVTVSELLFAPFSD
jgi:hypothetical protein